MCLKKDSVKTKEKTTPRSKYRKNKDKPRRSSFSSLSIQNSHQWTKGDMNEFQTVPKEDIDMNKKLLRD